MGAHRLPSFSMIDVPTSARCSACQNKSARRCRRAPKPLGRPHLGARCSALTDDNGNASCLVGRTDFVAETLLPTRFGNFRLRGYRHSTDSGRTQSEPSAIICGNPEGRDAVPVRVHDACFTSEVLGSLKCDCADQLSLALEFIREHPPGLVIYLQQEGRGIGLANKIAAYSLQEKGFDTVDANRELGLPDDCREYSSVCNILSDLNIKSIKLITNNPRKISKLEQLGIEVVGRIPCQVEPQKHSLGYLQVKKERMDHMLEGQWCYWDHAGDKEAPEQLRAATKDGSAPGPEQLGNGGYRPPHESNGDGVL